MPCLPCATIHLGYQRLAEVDKSRRSCRPFGLRLLRMRNHFSAVLSVSEGLAIRRCETVTCIQDKPKKRRNNATDVSDDALRIQAP